MFVVVLTNVLEHKYLILNLNLNVRNKHVFMTR